MDVSLNYIKGSCHQMCPTDEINMREKERLLHILEIVPGTENDSKPKADKNKIVKSFSRSAAGKTMHVSKNIRSPEGLQKAVSYLLDDIVARDDVPWTVIYDFVMDRLRAVRQDLVIQNASSAHYVTILQPIIRFHAYSSYRLCEENINTFDAHINNTHLQECLKKLLCTYDDIEHLGIEDTNETCNEFLSEHRPEFEALYVLLNLGNAEAINRALSLARQWRTNIVELALEMSLGYYNNNFVRTCRNLSELPLLHAMVAYLHLPNLRKNALKIMSVAYNSKNLTFPLHILRNLLFYTTNSELLQDCKYYGLEVKNEAVSFLKTAFNDSKPVTPVRRSQYIDEKLENMDISILMLYSN